MPGGKKHPLIVACEKGDLKAVKNEIFKFYVKEKDKTLGTITYKRCGGSRNCLYRLHYYANDEKYKLILDFFIEKEKKVDKNNKPKYDSVKLFSIKEWSDFLIIQMNKKKRANINTFNTLLINNKVDINHQSRKWSEKTALINASKHGHISYVKKLLEYGADTTIKCHDGFTAIEWAKQNEFNDIVKLLRTYKS